jgi:hypothetical protein
MSLPIEIRTAIREKLTESPAWAAFGVRPETLLGPRKTILSESAGAHRCRVEVDGHGVLSYTRIFPGGRELVAYADMSVYRRLPQVAVGLEWGDGTATLRLATSPDGLRSAPAIPARPRTSPCSG